MSVLAIWPFHKLDFSNATISANAYSVGTRVRAFRIARKDAVVRSTFIVPLYCLLAANHLLCYSALLIDCACICFTSRALRWYPI